MGEAYGSCAEGRAILGTRQRKIQRKNICVIFGEPPDADPHVRWCERGRLAAAPYSIRGVIALIHSHLTPNGRGCTLSIATWLDVVFFYPVAPALLSTSSSAVYYFGPGHNSLPIL